jgi:hypothetical protein
MQQPVLVRVVAEDVGMSEVGFVLLIDRAEVGEAPFATVGGSR